MDQEHEANFTARQDMGSGHRKAKEPPELMLDRATLYHGSATPGVRRLKEAEETTLGLGVYLVDNPADAAGYARRRLASRGPGPATVYTVQTHRLRVVNLDNQDKLTEVMTGFDQVLRVNLTKAGLSWFRENVINQSLAAIAAGVKPGRVREVAFSNGEIFTAYLQGLGYDGLKAREGGEGTEVRDHTTYLVFDCKKVDIVSSQILT
jgi:hypothetical protein